MTLTRSLGRLRTMAIKGWRSWKSAKALDAAKRRADRAMPELVAIQREIERNRRNHRPNKAQLDKIRALRFEKLREGF